MSVTDTFIPSTAGGKFGFLNVDAEWLQVRAAINGAGCRNPDQAWVVLRIGKATVMLARPRPARAPRPRDRERGDTSSRADKTTSSTSSSRAVPSGTQSPQTATNQSKTQNIKTSEKEQLVARIQEELAKKFSQHVQDLQRRMENVENENRKKDQELQKLRDELAKERQEKVKARKEAEVARKTIEQLKAQRDAPQASGSSTAKAGAQAKAAPAAKALPAKPFATKAAPKTIQKKPGKYADHPTSAPPPKTLDIHEQAARDAGCFFPPEERESSAESASRSMSDYESEEPAKNSRPRSNSDADENNVGGKRAAVLGSELPGSQ